MKRLFLLTTILAVIAGCAGDLIRSKVERGIENSLPEYIGPAVKYSATVSGPSEPMLRGKIKHLHIEGRQVEAAPSLIIDHLIVDMDDVEADTKTRQIRSVARTVFEAQVSEESVNRYIEASRTDTKGLKVALENASVTVTAYPSFLGIDTEFKVVGRPVVAGGGKVNFVADRAALVKIPVPAFIVNKVLERVNPVLDLSEMRFPVVLTSLTVKKGFVVIKGQATFKASG